MRLLLDTHVVIWLALDRARIPLSVLTAVADADTTFISVVSAWEYGIKRKQARRDFDLLFATLIDGLPATPLPLAFEVHPFAESLEPIHADPFDRMLIAQALHHDLTLVTADAAIRRYPVPTLWD